MRISVKCANRQCQGLNWISWLTHFWFYFVGMLVFYIVSMCISSLCLFPTLADLPYVSHLCASHLSALPPSLGI